MSGVQGLYLALCMLVGSLKVSNLGYVTVQKHERGPMRLD